MYKPYKHPQKNLEHLPTFRMTNAVSKFDSIQMSTALDYFSDFFLFLK